MSVGAVGMQRGEAAGRERAARRTRLGVIAVTVDDDDVVAVDFVKARPGGKPAHSGALRRAQAQIDEYLAGRRKRFTVPVELCGTPFQLVVWRAIQRVPYGETRTYAQLAASIRRPDSARAVGSACRANPVSILIPCHRIVGKTPLAIESRTIGISPLRDAGTCSVFDCSTY